jgi:hypothetical protein
MSDNKNNETVMTTDYILQQARKGFEEERTKILDVQGEQDESKNDENSEDSPNNDDSSDTSDTSATKDDNHTDDNATDTEKENEEIEIKEKEKDIPDFETKKQREAFIKMRKENEALNKENSKYEGTFKKLAERSGMSVEEYLEALDNNLLEEEAQKQNIPVETLKRIKTLEEQQQYNAEERRKMEFQSKIVDLQKSQNLTQDEVIKFIQESVGRGVDLENGNFDFEILYKGMFADEIIEKKIRQAEQERLAQIKKNRETAPTVDKTKGNSTEDDKGLEKAMTERAKALVKERLGY